MEETKFTEPTPVKKNTKKILMWGALGVVVLAGLSVGGFLLYKRYVALSMIDSAVTSVGDLLTDTTDVDSGLSDLSDNFLEAEVVSTTEVDESLTSIDAQLEALDGLSSDFSLESSDIGL